MKSRKQLRPATFWFDGGAHVRGWTDGDEWNGWGVPLFDERQLPSAIRALSDVGFSVERVGPARSLLRLKHEDEDHWTDYKPEIRNGNRFWRIDGLTWNESERGSVAQRSMREAPFRLSGWSVGYHDNISAHAAIRELKDNLMFVMTSDDREPRSLDDEATVGLYFFDGENWEQISYQDFPDVRSVIKLKDAELQLLIEHALSMDQVRALLIEELTDWENDHSQEDEAETPEWATGIFRDSGVLPEEQSPDVAASEAIEQVRNASPAQILQYMNERAEIINE